jgi:hypothetical protein
MNPIARFLLLTLLGAVTTREAIGGPNYLFPDILTYVREDQPYLVNWDILETSLRVDTVFANVGDGLFEIRSGPVIAPGTIQVLQRVYINTDAGAEFEDFPANTAVDAHQEHGHIHFEDFSMFELFEVTTDGGVYGVGERVAGGVKSSFRLRDSIQLPEPEWADRVSFPSSNTGTHQRISVGYGDEYKHGTEGQSFSIAGVPIGPLYWLRQTADPEDVILETDETNNSFEILIELARPGEAKLFGGVFLRPGDFVPPAEGDLNGDDLVTLADWTLFQQGLAQDLTGLTALERYLLGDLDTNGVHGMEDFALFRSAYAAAGGSTTSLIWQAVPEPSTIHLTALALILPCLRRRHGARRRNDRETYRSHARRGPARDKASCPSG